MLHQWWTWWWDEVECMEPKERGGEELREGDGGT